MIDDADKVEQNNSGGGTVLHSYTCKFRLNTLHVVDGLELVEEGCARGMEVPGVEVQVTIDNPYEEHFHNPIKQSEGHPSEA